MQKTGRFAIKNDLKRDNFRITPSLRVHLSQPLFLAYLAIYKSAHGIVLLRHKCVHQKTRLFYYCISSQLIEDMEVDENELFDKILQEIGGFGKYQKFLLFLRSCSFINRKM